MDGPASSSTDARQKRTAPAPLRERTSSRNVLSGGTFAADANASPPSTPQNLRRRVNKENDKKTGPGTGSGGKGKGSAVVKAQKENVNWTESNRHSHGLTWNSATRDSVVDNLLLSLDSLSSPQMRGTEPAGALETDLDSSRHQSAAPEPPQIYNRTPQRPRGHTYSSSLSSDYDRPGMNELSPSSTYSSRFSSKGRRSNSSSNIGALPTGRVRPARGVGRSSSETQKPVHSTVNVGMGTAHGRSELDEFNHGYEAALQSRRLAFNGRSVSMDQIYNGDLSRRSNSILGRGRPVPSVHSTYETASDPAACPEPGVPAGPRKMLNPQATGPVYVGQAPKASALRKTTTQSDLRSASTPNTAIPREIRDQASKFVRASSMRGEPQVPPSATSQRQYSAQSSTGASMQRRKECSSPPQERPGFFKRVFGGGSTRMHSGHSDSNSDITAGTATARLKSPLGNNNSASQKPDATSQSLNKKPSSFFRRRKKSARDEVALPPGLPVADKLKEAIAPAEASPSVSSLRKVLDPYLSPNANAAKRLRRADDSERPSTKESTDTDTDLDLFHTGYTPPPDASLGRRNPISREVSQSQKDKQSERMRLRVKKRTSAQNLVSQTMDKTFLHDARREPSCATSGESFKSAEQGMVSPVEERPPSVVEADARPVSRASTGDRIIAMKGSYGEEGQGTIRRVRPSKEDEVDEDDEGLGIMATPDSAGRNSNKSGGNRSNRLYLQPTTSEEERLRGPPKALKENGETRAASGTPLSSNKASLDSPTRPSPQSRTANSLPLMQVNSANIRESVEFGRPKSADIDEDADYRERARKIYEGDEEDVLKSEAASWLGERNPLSMRTLEAYMQLLDFSDQNILAALRTLCGKLILRGETQQFDRIVTALSSRWCECNPNHGFKAQDVVHTICYSLILLNTDLHLADIGDKMSRTAYVKNTLPTIKRVLEDAAPNAFEDTSRARRKDSRPNAQRLDFSSSVPSSPVFPPASSPSERTSFDLQRPQPNNKRLSLRPGMLRTESDGWIPDGTSSNALVSNSIDGSLRNWETEVETVLKSFFGSIRAEPLPLFGANMPDTAPSQNNLTAGNLGLKRSGSIVSKAPSDIASYRSKGDFRSMSTRWQGRNNRSRPKLYPSGTVASSRTSLDDGNSVWSPAQSSTWSKYSFGKTLTSSSLGSLGQHFSPTNGDFKHSIGFASALSNAIIREEGTATASLTDTDSFGMTSAATLDDEALALEGAPWAKEGMLKHKHHLDSPNHKAKERSWNECFAVIGKGRLTLFNMYGSSKGHTLGRKHQGTCGSNGNKGNRAASTTSTYVGGGDWMESAEQLLSLSLLQTIASTLPPPGYSKARPYVWALSLPSGAVHLFQVNTQEIAREFMTTANYWSARLSKEPLSGGVSNIEYGWSESVVDPALLPNQDGSSQSAATSPPTSMQTQHRGHMHSLSKDSMSGPTGGRRSSMQSSIRTSFEAQFGGDRRVRLPGDKVQIQEWTQPSQSMMASQLVEEDQLKALQTYVDNVEEELARHNELKDGIEIAVRLAPANELHTVSPILRRANEFRTHQYSPRHPNRAKALTNWQRKSDYLLREIVKFRTYIDSLHAAQTSRLDFEARRNPERAASSLAPSPSVSEKGEDRDFTPRADQLAGIFAHIRGSERDCEGDEEGEGERDVTPRASRVPPSVREA